MYMYKMGIWTSTMLRHFPHNTCQIYVKSHLKNTQMTLEYKIFDEKEARLFSGIWISVSKPFSWRHAWRNPLNCPHSVRNLWRVSQTMAKVLNPKQQKRRSRIDSNGSLHAFFAGMVWRPKIRKRDGLILVPSHRKYDILELFVF